jgi:hypothetical protein
MRQDGIPVEDIIDVVLPEVARSAGRRWMDDDISFADVTIVTARLQETVRALGRVPGAHIRHAWRTRSRPRRPGRASC